MSAGRRTPRFVADVEKYLITSRGSVAQRVAILRLRSESVGFTYEFVDNWGKKAIRRRTTGTGRMRSLKTVQRK